MCTEELEEIQRRIEAEIITMQTAVAQYHEVSRPIAPDIFISRRIAHMGLRMG